MKKELLRKKLIELLNKDIDYKNVVIWGTGNTSSLFQEGFERIKEYLNITAYTDSDYLKYETYYGYKVIKPKDILEIEDCIVLISAGLNSIKSIISECNKLGINNFMLLDAYIWIKFRDEILECFDLLDDDISVETYYQLVESRINNFGFFDSKLTCDKQYFALDKFNANDINKIFVDCGSYIGDTLEEYILENNGDFNKIIAFEPDKENYKKLLTRIKELKSKWNFCNDLIITYNNGVSDENGNYRLKKDTKEQGLGSKFIKNEIMSKEEFDIVETVRLDDVVDSEVSFIKADIESFEYRMLKGAKKLLEEYKPNLAICIYHNAVDFFSIIKLINQLNLGYSFNIRHHSYTLVETVLYAYVDKSKKLYKK